MKPLKAIIGAAILVAVAAVPLHAENWPQWRGPFFNGSTTEKGLPTVCDQSSQLWVTDLPGHSSATPIVWGDRVFVSSTDPESKGLLAMCLAAADGKVLWKNRVGGDIKAPRNNGASPSPCTDGKRAYFLYGSGDLAAFDFDGNALWSRNLIKDFGSLATKFGYSASPLLWKNKLYVLLIRRTKPYGSAGGQPDKPLDPLLVAINPATGKDLWKHVRPSDAQDESLEAYGTAIPYEGKGRAEILIEGAGYLTGHDPETGREFWRYGYNPSQATIWRHIPSPVAWEDLIFGVLARGGPTFAVKAGGSGTLGAAAAWKFGVRTTDSGTSLVYENSLYILQSDKADPVVKGSYVSPGIFLFCVDLNTGKDRAQIRLADGGFWRASPTGADGKVYCLSEAGEVVVVEAGGDHKILSRTKLGDEPTQATIAVSGGRLYVRTATKLHCFGKTKNKGVGMNLVKAIIGVTFLFAATAAQLHGENWPQWRGPLFNGSTTEKGLPDSCAKENQLWVTDLPGHSSATPIVWGDRIFVSATDPASKGILAMCLAAADGKVLWQKRIGDDLKAPRNDAATPSPCTDGKLAYFLYGTGDLAAFDFDGKPVWTRNIVKDYGNPCIKYGYSSSPIVYGGKVYVEMIRRAKPHFGEPGTDKPLDPYLLAINAATGKDLWRQIRPSDADDESLEAYTTPMVYARGGKAEIVLVGGDYLTGHDPATGRELWRLSYNPSRRGLWRLVPGCVAWEDLIFLAIPRGKGLWAAKTSGTGKLGDDAVAWKFDGSTTDSATPLVYDNALYVLDKAIICFDPRTGKERWRGDLKTLCTWRASPTGADGKIYCLSEDGEVAVLAAGGEFKILSRTKLGDGPTQATIVASGGRLYVRTATKLYCFGKPAK